MGQQPKTNTDVEDHGESNSVKKPDPKMDLWKPIFQLPDHVDEIARSEKELVGMEVVAFLHDRQVVYRFFL